VEPGETDRADTGPIDRREWRRAHGPDLTDGVTARLIAGGSRTDRQICRKVVSIRDARGQDKTR
jgi:hypothetical protein